MYSRFFIVYRNTKMPINQEQCENLKKHEGFMPRVYKCPAGKDSIAFGYNLEANPLNLSRQEISSFYSSGISEVRAEQLLKLCCNKIESQLQTKLDWYDDLDSNTQYVLINMAYNLGVAGLLEFKKTLGLIKQGKYGEASIEMLNSRWAKQVKTRATDLSRILKTGKVR